MGGMNEHAMAVADQKKDGIISLPFPLHWLVRQSLYFSNSSGFIYLVKIFVHSTYKEGKPSKL